jgi:hypothetical protein
MISAMLGIAMGLSMGSVVVSSGLVVVSGSYHWINKRKQNKGGLS